MAGIGLQSDHPLLLATTTELSLWKGDSNASLRVTLGVMSRFAEECGDAVKPAKAERLVAHGVTRRVLRGRRWKRTSYGFYLRPDARPSTPTQRIAEAASLLPAGGVIGGWAAAYSHGTNQLDGLNGFTMRPEPVVIYLPPGQHRRSTPTVRYRQDLISADDVTVRAGIPMLAAGPTALDLACRAPDLTEAVTALDAMLQARAVDYEALSARLEPLVGRRGVRQARCALELSRRGVKSTWESRLRMFWVLDLGLPSPLVNRAVYNERGEFLGEPDLLDVEAGLALEYDGASWHAERKLGHRDEKQHREDNVREELLERTGLIVCRTGKPDLTEYRSQLGRRLLAARADGLSRDRRRDCWFIGEA